MIATAIGAPPATTSVSAPQGPAELPSVAPKMVTLPTPAKVAARDAGSGLIGKLTAPLRTNTDSTAATAAGTAATKVTNKAAKPSGDATADGTAVTTPAGTGSVKSTGDSHKVTPGAVGAKDTKAGGGLSKLGGGHKSSSDSDK
jgi:hypothetical protein